MPSRLLVTQPNADRSSEVELVRDEIRIGRTPVLNDLLLADERVSRRHAVLRRLGRSYVLTDLESANGTFVNGQRITERILSGGDAIAIGRCMLVFEAGSEGPWIDEDTVGLDGAIVLRSPQQLGIGGSDQQPGAADEQLRTLRKKAETLTRFYELSQSLRLEFSLHEILKKVGHMLFRVTSADRYAILLKERDTDRIVPVAAETRWGQAEAGNSISISRAVLDRVVAEQAALLSLNAQEDERLGSDSIRMQKICSVMCAPLLRKDGILGAIYVDCRRGRAFSVDDLDVLNALAVQAAMAVENAMSHERLVNEALARAAYGRFMPRHVVEQILANPAAVDLGGSNQVITTLYADIRGFTRMAEALPPEKVVDLLNEFFAAMTPIVFSHGGALDKYVGDGLMALFGVPYASDTSASDAVACAVAMQQRMKQLNQELAGAALPEIAIGIGLNTGTATVGYVGSDQRTDYTAIGDAVNLAARLEKRAVASQILISSSTREAVGDDFVVKPLGAFQMRGRSFPVQVYEVIW